jgi:hypothetical protein
MRLPKHALGGLSTQDMHLLELNFNRRSESLKLWVAYKPLVVLYTTREQSRVPAVYMRLIHHTHM